MVQEVTTTTANVSVSPAVLFSIGEIYQRRNETAPTRVVGALFGAFDSQANGIQVNHCFVVPHSEVADQISINSDYYKQRSELHKQCYGKQSIIVGWFSITQDGVHISDKNTSFINDTFAREVATSSNSSISIHLNLHVSANGFIKRTTTITDMASKTTGPVEKSAVSFKTNDIFAIHAAADAIEAKPEEAVYKFASEVDFVTKRIAQLKEKLASLEEAQAKIKAGTLQVEPSIAKAIEEALNNNPLKQIVASKAAIEQDAKALRHAFDAIATQLEILDQITLYHA